ncbi:hypothetical protein JCM10213_004321 [Rhodosporidiobolus nylandii]
MRVFVTGASGFIGSAVVPELLSHGHTVLALARSEQQVQRFEAERGVAAHRGSLDDLESLRKGARKADGVIHLAFKHDFENYIANGKLDEQVTKALADALSGTNKPLVIASGTALFARDPSRDHAVPAREDDAFPESMHSLPRIASERILASCISEGVRGSVVRLPPSVHGDGDGGFVPAAIAAARKHAVSPYVGDGNNFWPGVHRLDAARLFRLAIEKAPAGSVFHALGKDGDGLAFKDLASITGEKLGVPVKAIQPDEAEAHFGFLAPFVALDNRVSSTKAKELLGWEPVERTLRQDLEQGSYF